MPPTNDARGAALMAPAFMALAFNAFDAFELALRRIEWRPVPSEAPEAAMAVCGSNFLSNTSCAEEEEVEVVVVRTLQRGCAEANE